MDIVGGAFAELSDPENFGVPFLDFCRGVIPVLRYSTSGLQTAIITSGVG
jgi:hypothetical protein